MYERCHDVRCRLAHARHHYLKLYFRFVQDDNLQNCRRTSFDDSSSLACEKSCAFRVQSKLVVSVTLDESNQYIRVLLRTDHKEIEEIDYFVAIIRVHRRHRNHKDARCIIVNQCVFCPVQTSLQTLDHSSRIIHGPVVRSSPFCRDTSIR